MMIGVEKRIKIFQKSKIVLFDVSRPVLSPIVSVRK
jgi:hypothetical protein